VTLDPSAHGGVEKPLGLGVSAKDSQQQPEASSSSAPKNAAASVPTGFGRIIRDAAGNIVGVEMNEEETAEEQPQPIDLEQDLDSRVDQSVREKWATDFSRSTAPSMGPKNESLVHSEFLYVNSTFAFMYIGTPLYFFNGCCLGVLSQGPLAPLKANNYCVVHFAFCSTRRVLRATILS
jgi:hypothetical protein